MKFSRGALVAALLAIPPGAIKGSSEGRVIYETETEYQYARVVEYPGGVRRLGRDLREIALSVVAAEMWRGIVALVGDGWGRSRVQTAWLSGLHLARAVTARLTH